jgi:hypothetical protein
MIKELDIAEMIRNKHFKVIPVGWGWGDLSDSAY